MIHIRSGTSLIETLSVMFICSLLLTASAGLIVSTFRIQRASIQQLHDTRSIEACFHRMRRDAHASSHAFTADQALVLQSADRMIEYSIAGDTIVRKLQLTTEKDSSTETWTMPGKVKIHWSIEKASGSLVRADIRFEDRPSWLPIQFASRIAVEEPEQ